MKNLKTMLVIVVSSTLLFSCSKDSSLANQFSKRKYLKKHHVHYAKSNSEIMPVVNVVKLQNANVEIVSEPNEEVLIASSSEKINNQILSSSYKSYDFKNNDKSNNIFSSNTNNTEPNVNISRNPKVTKHKFSERNNIVSANKNSPEGEQKGAHWSNIVSLITGILGIPILAIVFGAIGLNKKGKGMGIAGMVLGILVFLVIVALFL